MRKVGKMLSGSGIDYKQIAIQLIKDFCRNHELEATLYALEQETEEENCELPFSLLHLVQTQLEKPPKQQRKNSFESIGLKFVSSLPIDCKSKLTSVDSLTLASEPDLDVEQDTEFLLVGGTSKEVKLIRSESGDIARVYGHHETPILSVSVYPKDHRLAVSTSMDGNAILFDIYGNVLQTFKNHKKYVTRSLFSRDGEFLVTCSHDHTVCIYQRMNLEPNFGLKESLPFTGIIESADIHDNTLVIGVRGDNMLHFVDMNTLKIEKHNMNETGDDWVSFSPLDIQVSPDGKYVAVYTDSKSGRVIIYHYKSNEIAVNLWNLDVDEYSQPRLLWHPSGNALVCTSHDTLFVYDLKTGNHEKLRGHKERIRSLCFQGESLVSCSFDSTIRIWPLESITR
jgi:COMPASS component SWD3